ncbi:MAG: rolling circle replication-associated protein [Luteolibacter sp.]
MRFFTLNPSLKFVPFVEIDSAKAEEADARASVRRPAALAALLSIGHISRPVLKLKVWKDGSRADFPSIPDLHSSDDSPFPIFKRPEVSTRGLVTEFSSKSRNRFKRILATVRRSEVAFTVALTLPGGDISGISHDFVMECFRKLMRRLASVSRFAKVSGFWKREIQARGAIHYHLILYGVSEDLVRADFHAWIVRQWNSLVCSGLSEKQIEEHRWFHARSENMEVVRSTAYFAKYVGKSEATGELTGRWWGAFNGAALPISPVSEVELPEKAAVMMHRLARKRREKLSNSIKHRAIQNRIKESGFDIVSETDLWRLRSGYSFGGKVRNPQRSAEFLEDYQLVCQSAGVRPGKFRFKSKPVIACDPAAPAFALQALQFVSQTLNLNLQLHETPHQSRKDFIPCPLRPVPPGRQPIRRERMLTQADFSERFGSLSGGRGGYCHDDDCATRSVRRVAGGSPQDAVPAWL